VLSDRTKPLSEYISESACTLCYKDLGPQVSWRTVFLVEYFGPILITGILLLFRKQIYNTSLPLSFRQKLGVAMCLGHYIKRELETLYVHRFSSETMPLMNIFKNSAHYWLLFGVCNMYFFLKPSEAKSIAFDAVMASCFTLFEFLNFKTHVALKNLRKEGTTQRGIPKGWGFGMVSCANYLWESCAWLSFALMARIWGGYVFLVCSFF
jgi:very-long-chain enoyl-CoA reductase